VLGMGSLEILIILLVAFIVLGPQKMLEAARYLGDLVGQVRNAARSLPHVDLDELTNINIFKEDNNLSNSSETKQESLSEFKPVPTSTRKIAADITPVINEENPAQYMNEEIKDE
jgi:Sec-independent protein translocase protein TatA